VTTTYREGQFEGHPCAADDSLTSESPATGQANGALGCRVSQIGGKSPAHFTSTGICRET